MKKQCLIKHGKTISALTLQEKSAKCFYKETFAQSKKEKEHEHVFFQHHVQGFAMM
jgi:hypothetical protein